MTHGMSETQIYHTWEWMKTRCCNPRCKDYPRYGGRGIKICSQWIHSFKNFYKDMEKRPSSLHSLDRIDNDGNYSPENCRWATSKEQRRNNLRIYPFYARSPIGRWYYARIKLDFAQEHGLVRSKIAAVINGKRNHHKNWTFYSA